jgi:hypothetical protein
MPLKADKILSKYFSDGKRLVLRQKNVVLNFIYFAQNIIKKKEELPMLKLI